MYIRNILTKIKGLMHAGNDQVYFEMIQKVLQGDDEELWKFLTSNDLWGGAGSIADQALIDDKGLRKELERLLIDLAEQQTKEGRLNQRTKSWVDAFIAWSKK